MRKMKMKWGKENVVALCAAALLALPLSLATAGTEIVDSKAVKPASVADEKDWTIELGSGVSFSNVRVSDSSVKGYTLVPILLTASLQLDDVGLDHFLGGIFRGYTEFYFQGQYQPIVHGPEDWFAGLMVGPRYNFVQEGWPIIPYLEGGVGFGFADSAPQLGGLGEDFNFSFAVGTGFRYNINDSWFLRVGVTYQHMSNAGMSEPTNPNHPIDALGPRLSVGYNF